MKIVRGFEAAKTSLLQRLPLELAEAPPQMKERIREVFGEDLTLNEVVERIISDVRARGDAALFDYSRRIDGIELSSLEVTPEELSAANEQVDGELLSALTLAAERIRSFHLSQKRTSWVDFAEGGLGQILRPLGRVGVYAPGSTAPSTVLMAAIPAKVAGVGEIILVTPPRPDGTIPAPNLVAAQFAQVDRIFKLGGAQAIGALAYGTETVPKVDKICGPGNIFVTLAKKKVYGEVGIDALHGPTETVILADEGANPQFCAADLLAQAEHDVMASAIIITTSRELADKVREAVERQLPRLERKDTAAQSLESRGGIIVVESLDEAIELVNLYAPEHLCLMVKDAWSLVGKIRNAGGIFLGEGSPEALGDYVAGPSHIMPTGGSARFSSPLSVADFIKITSLVALNDKAAAEIGRAAATIARAEGLTAHAQAIEVRLDSLGSPRG
jgi:histidinol dehydrogenase